MEEKDMAKVFEDYFSELQADMVGICMEYVEYQADTIYIYCCCEGRMIHSDYFYEIEGRIVQKHQVNDVSFRSTATPQNESTCLSILIDDVRKLKKLCIEYDRPMPTQIKMIYNVKNNSLDAKYKYENQWLEDKIKSSPDIFVEWYEEVKNSKN